MANYQFDVKSSDAGIRLDRFLVLYSQQSRTLIQEHLKKGAVFVNSKTISKPAHKLREGDIVTITLDLNESSTTLTAIPGDLDIIFEDPELLIINKRQGVVVHPASGHRGDTLVHHLLHYLQNNPAYAESDTTRPGIVHRLDKGTSGILIVAKNRKAQEQISEQFKRRLVKKHYECLVWGQIQRPGKLKTAIGRDKIHRKKMSSKTRAPRQAETQFEPLEQFLHFTHLRVSPLTGRTHQIRVHLAEFGHSIVGDSLYGKGMTQKRQETLNPQLAEALNQNTMTFLHAQSIAFNHPTTQAPLSFEAPLPENFRTLLENLRGLDSK